MANLFLTNLSALRWSTIFSLDFLDCSLFSVSCTENMKLAWSMLTTIVIVLTFSHATVHGMSASLLLKTVLF